MKIPKARYLHKSYLVNESYKRVCAENNALLIIGNLTGELRYSANHRHGCISTFYSFDKYPYLIPDGKYNYAMEIVCKMFEVEGYQVRHIRDEHGFQIDISWTAKPTE